MGKTCCFIGHSEILENIRPALMATIERHITEYGVTDFLVGNYGAFDRMSAVAVKEAKKLHDDVRLFLALPYLPDSGRPLPDMKGFDGSIYPEGMEAAPRRFAISHLNRWMVNKADYVISYVTHSWGGAAQSLKWAKTRERRGKLVILNLGER